MRMSQLFSQTLREAPADAEVKSHQLLLRAGFIRPLAAGIFSYLPLGKRSMLKIENIMRDEIDGIGGQEVEMPVVNSAEIWQKTKRWYKIGSEMGRFQDKNGRDMVLAMTHEEVVADLVRREIQSHRQLPCLIYHIKTKWRDDPRPRAGLIRAREFTMLDAYSLDATEETLEKQYQDHYEAYFRIFGRCGLDTIAVEADVGMMGGSLSHEYMYLTEIGADTLLLCDNCDYKANQQVALFRKSKNAAETLLPIEKVATPNMKTIAGLADYLDVPKAKTAKAVFLVATISDEEQDESDHFVFAIVRGDMEVSHNKVSNTLKAKELRAATEAEIIAIGATPGYASPIGLDSDNFLMVVDDVVVESANLVAGANEEGYHYLNTNYGRDYDGALVADIAAAQGGDLCVECGSELKARRGVEVGNIFKLGTDFTEAMGGHFTTHDGKRAPVIMGSYGIGVGRLLACVAEEHNDENGLIWPITIAPYHVHIVTMRGGEEVAEQLYAELRQVGVEVLLDDRNAGPGVKFNDADLIGVPLRLTVGKRSLKKGGVEFKRRDSSERTLIPLADAVATIKQTVEQMLAELNTA